MGEGVYVSRVAIWRDLSRNLGVKLISNFKKYTQFYRVLRGTEHSPTPTPQKILLGAFKECIVLNKSPKRVTVSTQLLQNFTRDRTHFIQAEHIFLQTQEN